LQQFPDTWKFFGLARQKYTQIGNAVPTGLGKVIGKMLKHVATDTDEHGLPKDASPRLGKVIAADQKLENSLQCRLKTQLHPPWKRKNKDPEAARKWLSLVAA